MKVRVGMVIYGAQASRVSQTVGVDKAKAEEILKNYFKGFPDLARWLENIGTLAKHQKWVEDSIGRKYFVSEGNSKGADDENVYVRKAMNGVIQGLSSSTSKLAGWYVHQSFEEKNDYYASRITGFKRAEIVALVH